MYLLERISLPPDPKSQYACISSNCGRWSTFANGRADSPLDQLFSPLPAHLKTRNQNTKPPAHLKTRNQNTKRLQCKLTEEILIWAKVAHASQLRLRPLDLSSHQQRDCSTLSDILCERIDDWLSTTVRQADGRPCGLVGPRT